MFGTNLVDYWTVRQGAVGGANPYWVGGKRGITLAGFGTPTLAPDLTNYRGIPVWTFVTAAKQTLDTGALTSDLVAAGGKPYMWIIARHTATGGASQRIVAARTPGVEVQMALGDTDADGNTNGFFTGNVAVGSVAAPQSAPSLWELWYEPSNGARVLARNGVVLATSVSSAGIANPIRRIQMGGAVDTDTNYCTCTIAEAGLCVSKPEASRRARLLARSRAKWGI